MEDSRRPSDAEPAETGVELAPGVRAPESALRFSFSSASGPGGQNVNKRATKATLRLRIDQIPVHDRVRTRLRRLGAGWLVEGETPDDAELVISADEFRSQRRNREACLQRLRALLVRSMAKPKPRIATKPSRGAVERRLQSKREQSERKARRQRPADD